MKPMIIVAALAAVLVLTGCVALRDVVAGLIGAPTSTQIAGEMERLGAAENLVRGLERDLRTAEKAASEQDQLAAQAEDQKTTIRSLYASMAQQLANAEGPAADAMLGTLEDLQRQLRLVGQQKDRLAEVAAGYRAQADTIAGSIEEADQIIGDAEANLLGFADQQEAAIAGVMGAVGLAGDAANALGVPGGKAAVDTFGNIVTTGLSLLLGTSTIGAGVLARRRRKQRDVATGRRLNLVRAVQATDKFELIKDDEEARLGAKEFAGRAAHRELKLARLEDLEANGNGPA